MTNGWPSKQNPTWARKPASRISLIVSASCDPLSGMRRSSMRFVRFNLHPCVCCDPIHFPSLASVVGKRLFKVARSWSDVRDNKSNNDGSGIECFLIEKLAASILELADRGLAHSAAVTVNKIEAPLMGLGIV